MGLDVKRVAWFALLLNAAKWFLIAGTLVAAVVGVMMLFFPRPLGALEVHLNRWYSTRRLIPDGDEMNAKLDRLVEKHPAPAGWIIAISSLLVAVAMAVMLITKTLPA
jgi:hypothetical protein